MAKSLEPNTFKQAMRSPDAQQWRESIQLEYDNLVANDIFDIVLRPKDRKVLTSQWVLRRKLGAKAELIKYRSRIVARGFQQIEGEDFNKTFAATVKAPLYYVLFALMSIYG